MKLGEAIYYHLSKSTELAALIDARIYPIVIPQNGKLPCVVYQQISSPWIHAMGVDPDLRHPRYQISIFATSYSQVKNIAEKTRELLQDYKENIGGLEIQRIFFENEIDLHDIDLLDQSGTYRITQDYIIWYGG